jgi:3-deoxy-D-manno-octulosonate 8-phosphate phosphatase (KDO 8-P phosphatase)
MQGAERVRLLAMDVDGVLTDGVLYLSAQGDETKAFHVRDGMGIALALRGGLEVAFVTARVSPSVRRRAAELGVAHLIEGAQDKRASPERRRGWAWRRKKLPSSATT